MVSSDEDITFKSLTGLSFILLMVGTVFYVLGFGSNSWAVIEYKDDYRRFDLRQSLWQQCGCVDMDKDKLDGKLGVIYLPGTFFI